jgi:hypothetical protein
LVLVVFKLLLEILVEQVKILEFLDHQIQILLHCKQQVVGLVEILTDQDNLAAAAAVLPIHLALRDLEMLVDIHQWRDLMGEDLIPETELPELVEEEEVLVALVAPHLIQIVVAQVVRDYQ